MTQHATKKKNRLGLIPVRLLIAVPERGMVLATERMYRRLYAPVGRTGYAFHPSGRGAVERGMADRIALYSQEPRSVVDFLAELLTSSLPMHKVIDLHHAKSLAVP